MSTLGDTPLINHPDADPLELLDYRTLSTARRAELAPAGRYLALSGKDGTWLVALDAKTTHVGRGLLADVRFDDHRISRLHAIIADHGGRMRLLDGRSASGTFVNGRRVIAADLKDGDTIPLWTGHRPLRRTAPRTVSVRYGTFTAAEVPITRPFESSACASTKVVACGSRIAVSNTRFRALVSGLSEL